MKLLRKFKDEVFLLLELLFSKKRARADIKNFNKILVIQLQQLGDTLIFTPALRAIRSGYPHARIDLLVNTISFDVYRGTSYININKFWRLKKNRLISVDMIKLLPQIRKQRYDCSILCVSQKAFRYSLISYLTGAKERVGFNHGKRGFLNTIQVQFDRDESYINCNLKVVRALGINPCGSHLEIWHDEADRKYIEEFLIGNGISRKQLLVCIHPGSNWQSKRWLPDRFARVADFLVSNYQAQVIFSGTGKDRMVVEEIRGRMSQPSISLASKTNIKQLAALIERSDLFISVDSGPQHIASAVNTPMVLLMSAIDLPHRWRPWGEGHQVLFHRISCGPCYNHFCHTKECMRLITIDEVVTAVKRQICRIKNSRGTLNEKENKSWKKKSSEELKAKVRRWWDNHPMDYAVTSREGTKEFYKDIDRQFLKAHYFGQDIYPIFSRLIDYRALYRKKVLEVGCGLGTICQEFASQGALVTAVDMSNSAVKLTKKRLEIFGLKANIIRGDAENLPLGNNEHDYAFSWGVLHHTPDTQRAIDEVYRVLKPGGKLGIMLYHRDSLRYYLWTIFARGILGFKLLTMSRQQLINRYSDGKIYGGNPHTIFITRRDIPILFAKFKNVKFKVYGNKLEIAPYFKSTKFIPNSLADFILTKLSLGWFLWIQAEKDWS